MERGIRVLFWLGAALLWACAAPQARDDIRQGLLTLDLPQSAFLQVWGKPTHTIAMSGDEIIKAGVTGWGGFFFKRREMYEEWGYDRQKTDLIFYDHRLVAWQTSKTVEQLASPETQKAPEKVFPKY